MGNLTPPLDGGMTSSSSHSGRAHEIGDMVAANFGKYNLPSASHHTWNKIHTPKGVNPKKGYNFVNIIFMYPT